MKKCSKCSLNKDESLFSKGRDGLMRWCKACVRIYDKNRYESNKSAILKKKYKHKSVIVKRNKDFIKKYLSKSPCTDCGESNIVVLEFDHLCNKRFNISDASARGVALNTLIREIEKCEVVCANCHRIRTHNRREAAKCPKSHI